MKSAAAVVLGIVFAAAPAWADDARAAVRAALSEQAHVPSERPRYPDREHDPVRVEPRRHSHVDREEPARQREHKQNEKHEKERDRERSHRRRP